MSLLLLFLPVGLALQEQTPESEFADLGKLLLVGVLAAIVFALACTVIRLRLRDKRPPYPGFISINSFTNKK
jgi:hypothetical protein